MKTYPLTFLQIGLLTGTRAVAAAGLALVLSLKLRREHLLPVGWSLFGAGTVFHLVLLADLMLRQKNASMPDQEPTTPRLS